MTIKLMLNNSDNKKIGKSLTEVKNYSNAFFKDSNSILYPEILIVDDLDDVSFNYLYIEDLGRYYFIDDVTYSFNDGYSIKCSIDVLETYKDDILNKSAIISRQENKCNLYLSDDMFKIYQKPHVITKKFSSGFENPSFVLVVAGN